MQTDDRDPDLDAKAAELVMGWHREFGYCDEEEWMGPCAGFSVDEWQPSANWDDAGTVWEEARRRWPQLLPFCLRRELEINGYTQVVDAFPAMVQKLSPRTLTAACVRCAEAMK